MDIFSRLGKHTYFVDFVCWKQTKSTKINLVNLYENFPTTQHYQIVDILTIPPNALLNIRDWRSEYSVTKLKDHFFFYTLQYETINLPVAIYFTNKEVTAIFK